MSPGEAPSEISFSAVSSGPDSSSNMATVRPSASSRVARRTAQLGPLTRLVEHLDGAVAAVDPDPVAGVQPHGGVAAADDGRDAEFTGHDRGVGQRRADVGYDGGGTGEDRGPADV